MKKLFFLTLLACSFCISAWGRIMVANVGSYEALRDSLAAAASLDSAVITLTDDIEFNAVALHVPDGAKVLLNLNGHGIESTFTLRGSGDMYEDAVFHIQGLLHIISEGHEIIQKTVGAGSFEAGSAVFAPDGGTLIIDGGIFISGWADAGEGFLLHVQLPIFWSYNKPTIIINGGTFLKTTHTPIMVPFGMFQHQGGEAGTPNYAISGGIFAQVANHGIESKYLVTNYEIDTISYSNANVPGYTSETTAYIVHPKYNGASLADADENTSLQLDDDAEVDEDVEANYLMVGKGSTGVTVTINKDKTLNVKKLAFANANCKVVIKPGATLLSDNDIITVSNENIELTMDARGADPAVGEAYSVLAIKASTVQEKHPDATITLKSVCAFDGSKHSWQRFAIPTYLVGEKGVKVSDFANTEKIDVFGWNYYSSGSWQQLSGSTELKPFHGYTMTSIDEVSNIDFTFNTELVGNGNPTIDLYNGWNFLANSYSAQMDLIEVLKDFIGGSSSSIDAAVWVQDAPGSSSWTSKAFADIFVNPESLGEINPMQAFLVNRIGKDSSFTLDYEKYVWDPLMTRLGKASAPARRAPKMYEDLTYAVIAVEAGEEKEEVSLYLCSDFSNAKDNGFDIPKYMNSGKFNMYVVSPTLGELERVASNDLDNTSISLQTKGATSYKMKFDNVTLEGYQILDTETDVKTDIKAGGEYEFTANANALYEGRFLVIKKSEVPTSIEQTKTYKNNRIYTITGQYVGTNFNALPNGVYVVNGEKVVK